MAAESYAHGSREGYRLEMAANPLLLQRRCESLQSHTKADHADCPDLPMHFPGMPEPLESRIAPALGAFVSLSELTSPDGFVILGKMTEPGWAPWLAVPAIWTATALMTSWSLRLTSMDRQPIQGRSMCSLEEQVPLTRNSHLPAWME